MRRRLATATACVGFFLAGLFLGSGDRSPLTAQPAAEPKLPLPIESRLAANVYLQTAAEYRACCLQIYGLARQRLETLLKSVRPARPAVIMDLDETVLDNGAFQTFLYQNHLEFSPALWRVFERDYPNEVRLVPGAAPFIAQAERLGVTVLFISNRVEESRASTVKALANVGINTEGIEQRLLLRANDGSQDKSARRERAAAAYNVLLYFGDNLRDFSETFASPKFKPDDAEDIHRQVIADRFRKVEDAACHWGVDWFVLPNPLYGEWEVPVAAPDPRAYLHPTAMKLRQP